MPENRKRGWPMKYLSFKLIAFFIMLPAVLYISFMEFVVKDLYLGNYLTKQYGNEIERVLLGDTKPLTAGKTKLADAIANNIDNYFSVLPHAKLGVKPNVTVITKEGRLVYPDIAAEFAASSISDPARISFENTRFINDGLLVKTEFELRRPVTPLAISVLSVFLFISFLGTHLFYRSGRRRAMREDSEASEILEKLREQIAAGEEKLELLETENERLSLKHSNASRELERVRNKTSKNEEHMFDEIVALEEKLEEEKSLRIEQEKEIGELEDKVRQLEKIKRKDGKSSDMIQKRFRALYKNIAIHDKAVGGYSDLTEELKIKAEEVIHQLNDDPKLVTIKRKVFGKKNRETVLEVLFAYKGRLYFRNLNENRIEVLAIGTKNSQARELEFLNNL